MSDDAGDGGGLDFAASQGTIRVAFSVLGVLLLAPNLVLAWQYYRRSHLHPINGRSPRIVLLSTAAYLVGILVQVVHMSFLEGFPCEIWYVYRFLVPHVVGACYLLRIWYLIFKSELTLEQLASPELGGGGGGGGGGAPEEERMLVNHGHGARVGWFMSHRYMISRGFMARFLLAALAVLVLPYGLLYIGEPDVPKDGGRCSHTSSTLYLGLSNLFSVFLFVVYFSLKLREVVEGFFIKRELKVTALLVGVTFLGWGVAGTESFPGKTLAICVGYAALSAYSLGFPLYLSYNPTGVAVSAPEELGTLEGLLANPLGREAFKQHLCKEFSLENLVFVEEVDAFRADVEELYRRIRQRRRTRRRAARGNESKFAPVPHDDDDSMDDDDDLEDSFDSDEDEDDEEDNSFADLDDESATVSVNNHGLNMRCWRKALRVVDRHIREGAPYEVNLPYEIRARLVRSIRSARVSIMGRDLGGTDVAVEMDGLVNQAGRRPLAKISSTFFDEAQHSIVKLMRSDSYARFIMTPEYSDLVQSIARASKIQSNFSRL